MICPNDKKILRNFAFKVSEIASLPEMEEKRNIWFMHNHLQNTRPLVVCNPQGAWEELIKETDLKCEGELARKWERVLRMNIYQYEGLGDDTVVEATFKVPFKVTNNGFGVEIKKHHGENRGSYTWEPPITDLESAFEKLHFREFAVDREASDKELEIAQEIFRDILRVERGGTYWWTMGLTWTAIDLIGLENLMIYMYDDPENLHRLMKWLSDEQMNMIEWFENKGLLALNNSNNHVGSGGLGYSTELPQSDYIAGTNVRLKDLWGLAESQETVGVSPEMFAEFVLPYQLPLLDKFGLNCYGCCEPLELRWQYLKNAPNLRRVSVSPWSNQEIMADNLGKNYIFSRKPNPSLVCSAFDEEAIKKDLQETLRFAKDCIVEVILKDTHTVQNEPERLKKWIQLAYKEFGI